MRILQAAVLIVLPLLQDPAPPPAPAPSDGVDAKALGQFLEKRHLKPADFAWDLKYLDTMPDSVLSSFAAPKNDAGQLPMHREIQKAPLTFPDRIHELARKAAAFDDWHKLLSALAIVIDQPFEEPAAAAAGETDVSTLPDPLREPVGLLIGACLAAIAERDDRLRGATIVMRAIEATRPKLAAFDASQALDVTILTTHGKVVVKSGAAPATHTEPAALLWIDLGGDDTYEGSFAGADMRNPLRVVIDVAGNDKYTAERQALGYGRTSIGILADLAGDDVYTMTANTGLGAATDGVGILYDAAGNDRYIGQTQCQGAGIKGVGLLVDRAGRDYYEAESISQGASLERGAGVLLDLDGNDTYVARDPMHGQDVAQQPLPDDKAHSFSMSQGAAMGNPAEYRAGGLGLLVDARGNDIYRAGGWAMGAGYFLGIGALVDLEGMDSYEAWAYAGGAGTFAGFGLLSDRGGDDTYRLGSKHGFAVGVDFSLGMLLDGGGHDRYLNVTAGLGYAFSMSIAIFQDAAGDDTYEALDNNLGFGQQGPNEDANGDGKMTLTEKQHWGLFLDVSGLDTYPKASKGKNATAWEGSVYSGGVDLPSAPPPWKVPANWETLTATEVLKLGGSADAKLRATFALEHGLLREACDLLPPADAEAHFGKDVVALREKARSSKDPKEIAGLAAACDAVPEQRRLVARALVKDALVGRLDAWATPALAGMISKRTTLERLRGELIASTVEKRDNLNKRLAAVWADKLSVKPDPSVRGVGTALDGLDSSWRERQPAVGLNIDLEVITIQNFALTKQERNALIEADELAKVKVPPAIDKLNDYRVMLGRRRMTHDEELNKIAQEHAAAKGELERPTDLGRLVVKARTFEEAMHAWMTGNEHSYLLEATWSKCGLATAAGFTVITFK